MNPLPDIAADAPVVPALTKSATQFENYVRKHPVGTLLVAAGFGVAAVFITRAMAPPPPRHRALRLLEDIQERLSTLGEDGAHAVGRGMGSLGDIHLERSFDKLARRFKSLF